MVTVSFARIAPPLAGEDCGLAAFVDVETTGLSPKLDEVIELALVLFAYRRSTGEILGIVDEYTGLREPTRPIPPEATAVHGLSLSDVRGQRLDYDRMESILLRAEFLLAHNAYFDKGFVSPLSATAAEKLWVCSMRAVRWLDKGHKSRALQSLLRAYRIAPGAAHRATDDVLACLRLLSTVDVRTGQPFFAELLQRTLRRPP